VISVASSAVTGSDGAFFTENLVDGGVLDPRQTRWLSSNQLDYGTYYVRLLAHTEDFSTVEWSETGVLVIDRPPPPPRPPPVVRLLVRGWNGNDNTTGPLTKTRIGQRLTIELVGSFNDQSRMTAGQLCTLTTTGQRCQPWGAAALTYAVTRITPRMVVRGRVTFTSTYQGQTVAKKVLRATK
jgi:hypothetical protein